MNIKKQYKDYTFEETKEYIAKNNIINRQQFDRKNRVLCQKSRDEKIGNLSWMDIFFPIINRSKYNFKSIEEVKEFVNKNNITGRSDFQTRFEAAYSKAKKVIGFDEFMPSKSRQKLPPMTEEEFVKYIQTNNITSFTKLWDSSIAIKNQAVDNGWDEKYFPERKKFHHKNYEDWTLTDVVDLINKEHIDNYPEFHDKYQVLDGICHRKKQNDVFWIDIIYPDRNGPKYMDFTFEQYIDFIKLNKIQSRTELMTTAYKLYEKSKIEKYNDKFWIDISFPDHNTTIINSFIKNIDFWEALTIPEILCLASAFGEQSLMYKFLKKLAKSNSCTEERKFSLKEITEMDECDVIEKLDEDDYVKENDDVEEMMETFENIPSDEKEYQDELERLGKVMNGICKLQDNEELSEIINSGNVIETLRKSIINRITIISFEHPQIFNELNKKYC